MGRVTSTKFRLIYSETSRKLIRKLHPQLKPTIKSKIEQIRENPFIGKPLQNELSGYYSFRVKRFRIVYKIKSNENLIQIHYVGHRRDVYELLSEQLRKKQ